MFTSNERTADMDISQVSGTRIEFSGYTKQNVIIFRSAWPLFALPSMAAHLPYLPGSPVVSRQVLTSFVPPVHNPGCQLSSFAGSCPMENIPADYWLILCCSHCLLTPDLFISTFRWTFPDKRFLMSLSGL